MTKEEAIRAMSEGKKVRHRYFSKDEWVTINSSGLYEFEDGVKVDSSLFWMDRQDSYWMELSLTLNKNKMMSTEKDTCQKSGTSVIFQKEITQCSPHCRLMTKKRFVKKQVIEGTLRKGINSGLVSIKN